MYVVDYIIDGRKVRDETIDTPDEIRLRYAQERKVIIAIRKKYFVRGMPRREVIAFLTAMGDLAASGVHSTKALHSVIQSFPEKSHFRSMLRKILDAVSNGIPIGKAMESFPHVFGRTAIAMVHAGEHTGRLAETFITAADHIQTQDDITKEMWKKLYYPIATFVFGVVSLIVNSTFVIPKLMKSSLFKAANANSGGKSDMSAMCLNTLKMMSVVVPSLVCVVILGIVLCVLYFKHNQEEAEKWIIKIPGVKEFIFYRAYFVAFTSLSKLVEVGSRLDHALQIVERSTQFITLRRQFANAQAALREGRNFTDGLKALSPVEKTMLDTAQSKSRIHKNFGMIAQRYHRMYLDKVRSVSPKIQAIVIIMVVAIFFLEFLGMILPYGKIMQSIK